MELRVQEGGVRSLVAQSLPAGVAGLAWLGQAGFAVKHGQTLLLVDPYMSDHLANKYRGTLFPHVRMMPPPINPAEARDLNWVLCTHRHSDHMDPGTLPRLVEGNPFCRFLVPAAECQAAVNLGLPAERIVPVNAGDTVALGAAAEATAIPSAHETLETNEQGQHRFLGFILRMGTTTIYHSGDSVPYPGLAERLRRERIDLALLPVNGRDAYRTNHGVPGNMTFEEAVELCRAADIPWLVPHHFGMFDFNTVDTRELREAAASRGNRPRCRVPEVDQHFLLTPTVMEQ